MTMFRGFPKSGKQRRFIAEAVAPGGIDRRKLLGSVCACGFATLLDLELTCFAAADTVAAPARAIHAKLDADAQVIESKMVAWWRDIHQNPSLAIEKSVLPAWLRNTCGSLATRSARR